jgi:uncharacterized 2Fe-2S/4Fe-4S cluster protein (DUF4445 family)
LAGVRMRSVCGGSGTCGKCRIILEKGEAPPLGPRDGRFLTSDEISSGYRLACQTRIVGDAEVAIPPESRIDAQKILTEAAIPRVEIHPKVEKLYVRPEALPIRGTAVERLAGGIESEHHKTVRVSGSLSPKLVEVMDLEDAGVTVTMDQGRDIPKVFDVEAGDTSKRNHGLAIDVGTTKVAVYLVDLNDGRIIDVDSEYNRQLIYGEDLLSRIDYAQREREGLDKLQRAVMETINKLEDDIMSRNRVEIDEVTSICLSGNTVMTYLLLGMDPTILSKSDATVRRDPIEMRATRLGVKANEKATAFILPSVSRFVGGDAVGDVLASRLFDSSDISVLIDMGTNGEMILGSEGWLLSTSCAAGPAFEGWGISFGMRSVEGAIEQVAIDRETLASNYTVIGGSSVRPRGICGSGLIDAMAEMFRTGILDPLGRIGTTRKSTFIREGSEGLEYLVAPAEETDVEKDIVITQRDIDNLMDSKAAACAAIAILMKKAGLGVSDIENLYLCGAFGVYMNPNSATTIGVYPEFPNARIVQMGNGAIAGAYLTLVSIGERRRTGEIAGTMTYYDLTVDPDFMEEYEAALFIPGRRELFPNARNRGKA